ncbi:MAG: winged helix-turn-helix transcriptional regulator [Clostridia bacterium]|nr:winged helix-turn-helix transcriptional regulator [Clostridia bacterium]
MNLCVDDEIKLKGFMPEKDDVKTLAQFFYAFSDETRLRIVILLTIMPLCVSDISLVLNINQTTVSHQLKILRNIGIVEFDRDGKSIVYYIKNRDIFEMLNLSVDCV